MIVAVGLLAAACTTKATGAVQSAEKPSQASATGLDPSFGSEGEVTTSFSAGTDVIAAIAVQKDGKIVAVGNADSGAVFALARYDADGSLDTTFGDGGKVTVSFDPGSDFARDVAIQTDGKIVVAGPSANGGTSDFRLVGFNPDGTLDTSFGNGGTVTTSFHRRDDPWDMALQPDGKIVAAGYGAGSWVLARYLPDGSLDPTFGDRGQVIGGGGAAFGIALQPDGKIVAMGSGPKGRFAIARFDPNGTPDRTFGKGGLTESKAIPREAGGRILVQPDGKIVTVADGPSFTVVRFLPDGEPDPDFGIRGVSSVGLGSTFGSSLATAVALDPNGRIVAAGWASRSKTDSDFALARFASSSAPVTPSSSTGAPGVVWYVGAAVVAALLLLRRFRRVVI